MAAGLAAAAAAVVRRARGCRVGLPAARNFSFYTRDAADILLREYQLGRPAEVVPFEITEQQARQKFLDWQHGSARLGPGGLLPLGGRWNLRAALLPFWLFEVHARVEYAGSVGSAEKEGGPVTWRQVSWKELPYREHSWQHDRMMQVYASYKYRRDYAQVVNGTWALKRLQALPLEDAQAGSHRSATLSGGVQAAELDPPAMRQAIAWELVLRDVREAEHRAAEQRLLLTQGAQQVRDVQVRVHVLERRAQLAFFPCFHLEYELGEDFNAHGERIPARYEAIISGTVEGGVAGTRHYSAQRAGGSVVLAALGLTAAAAPLMGLDPWSLLNIETGFALFTASSLAGLSARMLPVWMQQAAEERRLRASDAEFERVISMGVGPMDTGTEEQEFLRSAAEWRRWEGVGSEPWREHKREAWAEELLQSQHRRRVEREQLRVKLDADRARQEEEERREERRQQRYGRSSHAYHWRQQEQVFSGGTRGGGRRDYLGYYHLLGLDAAHSRGHISQDEVKRAFRRAALRWHPDKQEVADDHGKRQAREKFQQIRTAYDVLRDPDRRAAYDRGEVVEM